jgi:hypothetical protein
MDDKIRKGRHSHGESHGCAKLTEPTIREIRSFQGSHSAAARRFGLSLSHVSAIRRGLAWRHLRDDELEQPHRSCDQAHS